MWGRAVHRHPDEKNVKHNPLHPPPVHHFSFLNFQICFHHSAASKLLLSLSSNRKPAERANEDKVSRNLGHSVFLLEHLMLISPLKSSSAHVDLDPLHSVPCSLLLFASFLLSYFPF